MENEETYNVTFQELLLPNGDSVRMVFNISLGEKINPKSIEIDLSRSFIGSGKIQQNPDEIYKIAAKAVELFLLKEIPEDCFDAKQNIIIITTYWYPGFPNSVEKIEEYKLFHVAKPKTT
jgi:hypothetical protein